jgi:DNA-binding MarR family transcriptional regulator
MVMSYANDMPTATETALASTLRLSVMRLARRLRAQRADTSLTLSQLSALTTLDLHGPLSPGELAAHEKISPPSTTRLLAVLESSGLVERTAHPTDGRQVLLAVSRVGQALLKEDRRRRDVWLAQRLKDLDAEDLDVLRSAVRILDRLAGS